jgi:uncharacterized protein (TIGR00730 family)
MVSEIILEEKGRVKAARVLLKFNTPIKKYPEFGTWCYLLDAGKEVVVFDTGPRYNAFRPIFRRFSKKLDNSELIISALEKYFPGKTIREIIFSHLHYDHTESGPELQEKIKEKFGNIPPIRLHKRDFQNRKVMKIYTQNLEKIYKHAGYKNWKIGNFVKNNEKIFGTDFSIVHLPGHTEGTIGLISEKHKIIICGWWINKIEKKSVSLALKLINENNKKLKSTIKKATLEGYNYYYYHPNIKKEKRVLISIKKIFMKKIAVFCSSSNNIDEKYFKTASKLGKELALRNAKVIFGGGNSGSMKALAESVLENKGKLVSIYINRQKDAFKKGKAISVRNEYSRKKNLIKKSEIIICLPGGFGTLEELHTVLSLKQLKKINNQLLIINTDDFFNPILEMHEKIFNEKFADKEEFYKVFNSVEELCFFLDNEIR